MFDVLYYIQNNSDVRATFGNTGHREATAHWYAFGITEGRKGSGQFDPKYYLNTYPDLRAALGATNYKAAIEHWLVSGQKEGRKGVTDIQGRASLLFLLGCVVVAGIYGAATASMSILFVQSLPAALAIGLVLAI